MSKTVVMIGVTIVMICLSFVSGAWPASLSDISGKLKALEPNTDYKITDITSNKMTVSDPTGMKSTFEGVNTNGLKVGDILKGSALQEKLGLAGGKVGLPESIPGLK
jgi:hypothetical protein